MIWEKIRGHQQQVEMFRRSLSRGRLSHAYLFLGPQGVGKSLFARSLAQCLLCERFSEAELEACGECGSCRMMQAGSHPDFLFVGRPEGRNIVPVELIIGEAERRGREGLCHDISLRPMVGRRRMAVVDDADLMTQETSNALLKTLEEPPQGSVLIIIASEADNLLPTIRSRCQLVRFGLLPAADVEALLRELEMAESDAEAAAAAELCDGSLAAAARLLDPKLRELRELVCRGLAARPYRGLEIAGQVLAGVEAAGGDAPTQRQLAQWIVRFTAEYFREVLRRQLVPPDAPKEELRPAALTQWTDRFQGQLPADPVEAADLVLELIERTTLTEAHLAANTPVPQCLEGMFLDLGRLLQPQPAR